MTSAQFPIKAAIGPGYTAAAFTGDFETGDLGQWTGGTLTSGGAAIASIVDATVDPTHVHSGRYSAKMTLGGSGPYRSEIVSGLAFHEEDCAEFNFWCFLDPAWPINTDWQIISQWRQNDFGIAAWQNASPPFSLQAGSNYDGQDGTMFSFVGGPGSGGPARFPIWFINLAPVILGRWIHWVIRIRFSVTNARSRLQVILNDATVFDGPPPAASRMGLLYPVATTVDRYTDGWRVGIYRNSPITKQVSAWFDDATVTRWYP